MMATMKLLRRFLALFAEELPPPGSKCNCGQPATKALGEKTLCTKCWNCALAW